MAPPLPESSTLTWALMLGLLSASTSACHRPKSSGHVEPDTTYPVGHPCHGKGNCSWYRRLPDGGIAPNDSDAGQLTICGPCNG